MKRLEVLQGTKIGHLTIIKEVEAIKLPCGQPNRAFLCKCDCGEEKIVRLVHLIRGRILSCSCKNAIPKLEKKKNIYKKWLAIQYRCHEIKKENCYTRKKIEVCKQWRNDYYSFKEWALNNGYQKELEIDRIDNTKGYYPENCRFTTSIINGNNKENTIFVIYENKKIALSLLLREKNLINRYYTYRARIATGWDITKAIDTPIRKLNYAKPR